MMHAVLYRSQQAIGAVLASLVAQGFSNDTVTNNKILSPINWKLWFATVFGVDVGAARIQVPFLNNIGSVHLRPFGILAAAGNNPNTADFSRNPIQLRQTENIDVQTTNTNAAPQIHTAILQLSDGNIAIPDGRVVNVFASHSVALTANVWNRISPIYQDNLGNNTYVIVGMEVFSATGLLARLDIPNNPWRPGVPVINSIANRAFWKQYDMPFGELGRFSNQALPALEIFPTAADASVSIWLKCVVI